MVFRLALELGQQKEKTGKIRPEESNYHQAKESSPKYRSVKLLFAISPYKLNESRAVAFLEKEQVVTGRNEEDRVDQSEPSVEG